MHPSVKSRLLIPLIVLGIVAVGAPLASATANTGWTTPYAGTPTYVQYAPTEGTTPKRLHAPLGLARADELAAAFGFEKSKAFSRRQFALFMAGRGNGGGNAAGRMAAYLTDSCSRYLTNTTGAAAMYRDINGVRTPILLGSYGLIVNADGMLESPANSTSPCRIINWVIAPKVICQFPESDIPEGVPCGYMGTWMRNNHARDTLKELYSSAWTGEAVYGDKSQDASGVAQLVTNRKRAGRTATVGMSMVPSIWIVNFLLIYALSPDLAAKMPAYWAPIPAVVADAIRQSATGQVPYADYQQLLGG